MKKVCFFFLIIKLDSYLFFFLQDDEWRKKIKELEEQMQLAIEESEMQKIAALASQEKKFNTINELLETFKTVNILKKKFFKYKFLLFNLEKFVTSK